MLHECTIHKEHSIFLGDDDYDDDEECGNEEKEEEGGLEELGSVGMDGTYSTLPLPWA